jgi:SpoVK/Ycf46/Vps4 family AAA+-type ATPase
MILKQHTARVLDDAQKHGDLLLDDIVNGSAEVQKNEPTARVFKLTTALLSDISKILSELAQLASKEVISKGDNDYLLRVTKTLYDITNQSQVEVQILIDLCLLVPRDDDFADIMARYRDKFTRAGSRYD